MDCELCIVWVFTFVELYYCKGLLYLLLSFVIIIEFCIVLMYVNVHAHAHVIWIVKVIEF